MSVIFQKLKPLKNRSLEPDELLRQEPSKGKKVYAFRKLVFSPAGALLIFAVIAGFGLISFFSLSFLKDYLDSASGNAILVQHQQQEIPPEGASFADEPAAAPGTDPAARAAPGPGQVPDMPKTETEIKEFKAPEYFVHQARQSTAEGSTVMPDSGDYPAAPPKTQFIPSIKSIYHPLSKVPQTSDVFVPAADDATAALTPGFRNDNQKTAADVQPQRQAPEPVEKDSAGPDSPFPKTLLQKKHQAAQAVMRLAKKEKTREVSVLATLAADLEDAVEENDMARIDTLLATLARTKDNNSAYYLKLKAFKEIREENYDLAKMLLNKVLAKDKTDYEAGINMAIIEIREQAFESARQRLIQLKEHHPSQSAVDDLLNKL